MTRAYTVHAPPGPDAPERFAFIKDGIAWPALFFPILWILWHRLWLTLLCFTIFVLLIAWTGRLANEQIATILAVLGGLLFALEANNLRRLTFARRGWRDVGSAVGRNFEEAEIRFFGNWNRAHSPEASAGSAHPEPDAGTRVPARPIRPADRTDENVFGLFPEPER